MPDPVYKEQDWDTRPDGTRKGLGFLGALVRPDGGVMSEFSLADSEHLKDAQGQYMDYPSLVPTLTPAEIRFLLNAKEGTKIPDSIYEKAEAFALQRQQAGLPLFAEPSEAQEWLYPEFRRASTQALSGDIHLPNETGPTSIKDHAAQFGPPRK